MKARICFGVLVLLVLVVNAVVLMEEEEDEEEEEEEERRRGLGPGSAETGARKGLDNKINKMEIHTCGRTKQPQDLILLFSYISCIDYIMDLIG